MKEKWKNYLSKFKSKKIRNIEYSYPVKDLDTDSNVLKQDPAKINRENKLISNFLDRKWRVAIDFGCGIGSKFNLFDKKNYKNNLLIGIEPDFSRFTRAVKRAGKLRWITTKILNAGIEFLEKSPSNLLIDLIICIQVLGHVTQKQFENIIDVFNKVISPVGSFVIAVPIIGSGFKDNIDAKEWDGTSDFTHLVNFDKVPGEKGYRHYVGLDKFNEISKKPVPNRLPVRSFLLPDFPDPNKIEIPYKFDKLPSTIEKALKNDIVPEEIYLYSIHKDSKHSNFPIGDLIIYLHKI
ncbi:MAG: hypothetical protein GF329_18825 [Candidatus Lokiarchaeota archaeon]|nr:hypothetical protein [Candidatus Lokiarchaeota archaeon]